MHLSSNWLGVMLMVLLTLITDTAICKVLFSNV